MKNFYTFLIIKNNSAKTLSFTLNSRFIRRVLLGLAGFIGLLLLFLSNYFGLHVDRWKMAQLEKENRQLESRLARLDDQVQDMEGTVQQLSDFSTKLKRITNVNFHDPNFSGPVMGGEFHSRSAIMALSRPTPNRALAQAEIPSASSPKAQVKKALFFETPNLELRIENLKGKSKLVKQSAWTLYTDLLEKKELLNNTPSLKPVQGWLSSGFGYRNESVFTDHGHHFHKGVDFAARSGSPVISSADGTVTFTGYDENGFGNLVIVDHGYGLKTYYGHLSSIETKIGTTVKKAEIIGRVGNTGKSTGPHLHYEVRIFGIPVNPENYILDQPMFSAL